MPIKPSGCCAISPGLLLSLALPLIQATTYLIRREDRHRSVGILLAVAATSAFNIGTTFAFRQQTLVYDYLYVMMLPLRRSYWPMPSMRACQHL
jgi:hypothetical protein